MVFQAGTVIYQAGQMGDLFYIIKSGVVDVISDNVVVQKLYKGDFFGENSIFNDEERKNTMRAESKTVCISLRWEFVNVVLGGDIKSILNSNSIRSAIENSTVLNNLAVEQINALVQKSSIELFAAGDVVIPKGT